MAEAIARLMERPGAESKTAEETTAHERGAAQESGAVREGAAAREGEEAAAGSRARSNAIANEAEATTRQAVLRGQAQAAERTEIRQAVEEARVERLQEVNRARKNPAAARDGAADAREQKSLGARAWESIKTYGSWAGNQIVQAVIQIVQAVKQIVQAVIQIVQAVIQIVQAVIQILQAVIIILIMDQLEKVLEKIGMVGKPADGAKPSESGSGSGTGGSTSGGISGVATSTGGTSTSTTGISNSEAAKVLDLFKTLNSCDKKTVNIVTDWIQWIADHLEHKNEYGSVTVDGDEVYYFVIFQTKVMELGIWHTENVVPAFETVLSVKTVASVKSMIEKSLEYTEKVKLVADRIKEKYTLMTAAGLRNPVDDLVGTIITLEAESKK